MPAPTANEVWRDYVTEGVPGSGTHEPRKIDARTWGTDLEQRVIATDTVMQAVEDATEAAQAASDAAAEIATKVLPDYTTRTATATATIPALLTRLRVGSFDQIGDGGGASYLEVPNTGDLKIWQFQSNGGTRRWSLQETTVRPEMLGCIGGARDVALPYLQGCVDYLATIGGGTVFLPSIHTYKMQGMLSISTPHITLTGGGLIERTDIPTSGSNVVLVNGADYTSLIGVRIAGNPSTPHATDSAYGVVVAGSDYFLMRGCDLYNHGGMGIVVSDALNPIVEGNRVFSCKSDGIHYSNGCRLGFIRKNMVLSSGDDLISVTDDNSGGTDRPRQIAISENIVQGNVWGAGIRVSHADRISVVNNIIEETSHHGITNLTWNGTAAATFLLVSGNKVRRTGRIFSGDAGQNPQGYPTGTSYVHGIYLAHVVHAEVIGNMVEDVKIAPPTGSTRATAIVIDDDVANVSVRDNSIHDCRRGIGTHDTSEAAFVKILNAVIEDNHISNIGYEGIWFSPVGGNGGPLTIKGNNVYNCNLSGGGTDAILVSNTGTNRLTVNSNVTTGKVVNIDFATCTNVRAENIPVALTVNFATPGNAAWTVTRDLAFATVRGGRVLVEFDLGRTVTHTTASGALTIGNMPYAASGAAGMRYYGVTRFSGITKAGYTQFVPQITQGGTTATIQACGSGQVPSDVAAADVPTGGSLAICGNIEYSIAA